MQLHTDAYDDEFDDEDLEAHQQAESELSPRPASEGSDDLANYGYDEGRLHPEMHHEDSEASRDLDFPDFPERPVDPTDAQIESDGSDFIESGEEHNKSYMDLKEEEEDEDDADHEDEDGNSK